jgi:lipopolysaccharide transport system ATP-binding protein
MRMSDIAIHSEGLGKRYRLGASTSSRFRYKSLREAIVQRARAPFRGRSDEDRTPFWALRDVSFEIHRGEAVGVIGRNGAGKSTLLKILSRITDPTEGHVDLWGRVGSLLEVGTGFHPELTGRENIYLNGAILGMRTSEITSRFDEIVAFADVEKFLDTPVKHYSSGMFVRLAFAVAAHLEPEILIVDEVLAVGDAAFQRKCLGKMSEVGREGRTILFVSHNMQAVRQLCSRALWIEGGRIAGAGPSAEVVDAYLASVAGAEALEALPALIADLPADPVFRLRALRVLQGDTPRTDVVSGKPVVLEVDYEVLQEATGFHLSLELRDAEGLLLFESLHNGDEPEVPRTAPGRYVSRATIPADFLAATAYELALDASIPGVRHCLPRTIRIPLTVEAVGLVNRAYPGYRTPARLAPLLEWRTEVRGLGPKE